MASPTKEMEKDARHGSGTMSAQLSAQREEESVGNHDTCGTWLMNLSGHKKETTS